MAVFADPTGAVLGIWQPNQMQGAQLVNEPVALCWNELNTRDLEAAKAFYAAVFGWDPEVTEGYVTFHNPAFDNEDGVAGLIDMTGRVPDEIPAHWMVYFAVEDTDATCAKAGELGGSVAVGPLDIPPGRFAVLNDPNGTHFAAIALTQ
jgi:predicted enzyme related to lactoylglutathione lyase